MSNSTIRRDRFMHCWAGDPVAANGKRATLARRFVNAWSVAALLLLLATQTLAAMPKEETEAEFAARCRSVAAGICLSLNSEAEIASLRSVPQHLTTDTRIQWDPTHNAARFTIASRSPADSAGQLHIPFPASLTDVYFSFDVRYPSAFLKHRFIHNGGWKMFILGQGKAGCAPYEIVANNAYYRGYPSFYYKCGEFRGVAVQNPTGDNPSQFDYQPGGDTSCMRHPDPRAKPCAKFEADSWVTYQVHVNTIAAFLEVWQTVNGATTKIIEHPLQGFPLPAVRYDWLKLTPYDTGKEATENHPSFPIWYRRVIVAAKKIPTPVGEK